MMIMISIKVLQNSKTKNKKQKTKNKKKYSKNMN